MELGCDSVQVVATLHLENDSWLRTSFGKGNIYARHGAVRGWLDSQDGMLLADEIADAMSNEEDSY